MVCTGTSGCLSRRLSRDGLFCVQDCQVYRPVRRGSVSSMKITCQASFEQYNLLSLSVKDNLGFAAGIAAPQTLTWRHRCSVTWQTLVSIAY